MERPELLHHIINAVADPIFVKNERHEFVLVNDALCRLLGHSREDLLGKSDYDFFPEAEADVFWRLDDQVFSTGRENLNEEKITDAQGKTHIISTKKAVFLDANSHEKFLVGVIRDVTHQKETEAQLEGALAQLQQQSLTDSLTGLNNRRGFLLVGQQQMKTAVRLQKTACLFYLDLDNLKFVNDTLGHKKGDELLVNTARVLEGFFRNSDVLARLGGDEFVALTINEDPEDAPKIEARLQEVIDIYNASPENVPIRASIGFARALSGQPVTLEDLLSQADQAMYRVKRIRRSTLPNSSQPG